MHSGLSNAALFWVIFLSVLFFVAVFIAYRLYVAHLNRDYERKTGKTVSQGNADFLNTVAQNPDILTAILPTSVLEEHAKKTEFQTRIKVNKAAAQRGLTPEAYIPVAQKEEGARAAINAGLELNSQVFRRQQQLLAEIAELEAQLPQLKGTARQLIKDSIKSKRAEYEQLGRPSV